MDAILDGDQKINKWTPNIGLVSIGHKKADPNDDDMIKNKTLIL